MIESCKRYQVLIELVRMLHYRTCNLVWPFHSPLHSNEFYHTGRTYLSDSYIEHGSDACYDWCLLLPARIPPVPHQLGFTNNGLESSSKPRLVIT